MSEFKLAKTLCENLNFAASEAYKRLRTNVAFSFADGAKKRVIGITSAQLSDGKSTTAVNFAYTLSELEDVKVLLIDGDMRNPSIHTKLGIDQKPGLSNLLCGTEPDGINIKRYKATKNNRYFDILPAGDIPPNPNELFNSERMGKLMDQLKQVYDYIIIDLPPVGPVADAQSASKYCDGMIVVVRENSCPREVLQDTVAQLEYVNANIIGFVMNGSRQGLKGYGYKKYGYGKYGYGKYGYGKYGYGKYGYGNNK